MDVAQGVAGSGSPLEFEAANKLVSSNCKAAKALTATINDLVEAGKACSTKEAVSLNEVR